MPDTAPFERYTSRPRRKAPLPCVPARGMCAACGRQITFEVITLRSGRLFRKFLMIRKAGKVMQVTGPMVRRGSRIVIPTGKRNGAPLPPVRLSRARGGFQRAWGGSPVWSTRVTLPHRTRRIGGAMHRSHPWDVEDIATFKTHPSLMSESSPARSYDRFSDSAESLAAAPSVFEQLSVVFDSFSGHVPL